MYSNIKQFLLRAFMYMYGYFYTVKLTLYVPACSNDAVFTANSQIAMYSFPTHILKYDLR